MTDKNLKQNEEDYVYEFKEYDLRARQWVTKELHLTNGDEYEYRDLIDFLRYNDHRTELDEEYERKHRDKVIHNSGKIGGESSYSDDVFKDDPIEQIPDLRAYVFDVLFQNNDVKIAKREMISRVRRILFTFPENQIKLIYMHYGEGRTLEEIRREEEKSTGKKITHQAMSNRHRRVLEKFRKRYLERYPDPGLMALR